MGRTKVKFRRQKHTERQIQDQLEKERQINPSMELPTNFTVTQRDQIMVEQRVFQIYQIFSELPHSSKSFMMELQRDSHIEYLTKGLRGLNSSFSCLDANRPWLCYWILHSLALLDEPVDDDLENSSIDFLRRCQDPNGGYGGGPGQMPHLATTYAAVNALISVGGEGAFSSVNRDSIYSFLRRMKQSNGGFRMHDGGEVDVRACYTAISVASILNVLDYELIRNVGDYILSCQTHEGGISGEPGSEAHGGYTYCGVAAMILINEVERLDLLGLLDWVVFRQGVECGFQGRTNKLVDGCYSFWQGGVCTILQRLLPIINRQLGITEVEDDSTTDATLASSDEEDDLGSGSVRVEEACQFKNGGSQHVSSSASLLSNTGHKFLDLPSKITPLFNSIALQQYIILCSQLPEGGFRDKPGKGRDFYHTCYCLSGLSVCQYSGSIEVDSTPSQRDVLGPYLNLVEPIHPVYNVVLSKYQEAFEFFHGSKVA